MRRRSSVLALIILLLFLCALSACKEGVTENSVQESESIEASPVSPPETEAPSLGDEESSAEDDAYSTESIEAPPVSPAETEAPSSGEEKNDAEDEVYFTELDEQTLVGPDGTEYRFLADEGALYYLGELELKAYIEGEPHEILYFGYYPLQIGVFTIEGDTEENLLVRQRPDSEWFSIYRRASLPDFDYSVENCSRLELLLHDEWPDESNHLSCGGGLTDPEEIRAFLSDVGQQKNAAEAGLYDLVTLPGPEIRYENCYVLGRVFGFFEEEPHLAVCLHVTSFDDRAYAIELGSVQRVLPEEWIPRLLADGSSEPGA